MFFFVLLAVVPSAPAGAQVTNPNLADTDETLEQIVLTRGTRELDRVDSCRYVLNGAGILVLQAEAEPIKKGEVHLDSEDAVLIIEKLAPSQVRDRLLAKLHVDGEIAKLGHNLRLTPYVNGTLVQPHGDDYQPLTTYNENRYQGTGRTYSLYKYYKAKELGEDNDRIHSFVLKRGYMATFAANQDGTGVSKVYIAHDRDLKIAQLPSGLRAEVSFIRVFKWRWTGKKGYGGNQQHSEMVGAHWHYKWDAGGESTLDMEYVPMKHNAHWPSFKQINQKTDVTHLLGFNEPMQKDQANMSIDQALKLWPKLQQSGLRLGSPCPTDGGPAIDWVVEFVNQADERGYRIDFVTVHYYKHEWTEERLIAWLKNIHDRTGGRPLWVTEFNNGARWVKNHNPTLQQNAKNIGVLSRAMDRCDFVERYAVFDFQTNRAIIQKDKKQLSPAGRVYRDNPSAEAYTGRR